MGAGGGEVLLGPQALLEAEQGLKPSIYSLFTGFALVARGDFNGTPSFCWRVTVETIQYVVTLCTEHAVRWRGEGGRRGLSTHLPSRLHLPSLTPPLQWRVQPLAWPPLPKMPVGPQWPLCLGVHFLFQGPRPVNSGDQRAGSRSPDLLNLLQLATW